MKKIYVQQKTQTTPEVGKPKITLKNISLIPLKD